MELKQLLHTTPRYIAILEQNNIKTLRDFFNYFPRTYEDRSQIRPLNELVFDAKGSTATKGQIIQKKQWMRGGKTIYDIKFADQYGNIGYISIYNSAFLANKLVEKSWYIIVGKPQMKFGKIIFNHPDVVPATAPETNPLTKGVAEGGGGNDDTGSYNS
jgi:ATP-dependent DNA helicase RecG